MRKSSLSFLTISLFSIFATASTCADKVLKLYQNGGRPSLSIPWSPPIEKKLLKGNGISVSVIRSDEPDNIASLPGDVILSLKSLAKVYETQPTNTVDVWDEQSRLYRNTAYYFVAHDSNSELLGMIGLIICNAHSPTSLERFGIKDQSSLQVEIGPNLSLKAGYSTFKILVKTAVEFMTEKNVPLETSIYFWADHPVWASALQRLGSQTIPVSQPGIWAFKTPFKVFLDKFSSK